MEKKNTELLAMVGSQVAIAAMVIALFTWNRSESRADYRQMDTKIDQTHEMISAIHQEMKDFHGRLCAIEEKYRQVERK